MNKWKMIVKKWNSKDDIFDKDQDKQVVVAENQVWPEFVPKRKAIRQL